MNTTEWVRKYNEAFEQADRIQSLDWAMKCFAEAVDRSADQSSREVVKRALQEYEESFLSHFEPKEVVDDGKVVQKALNQKETPWNKWPGDPYAPFP